MNVLFAGGGTGGHVYPAVALADALRGRANIRFIGSADRLERTIVPQAGYAIDFIASSPLERRLNGATLRTGAATLAGVAQSLRKIAQFKPDLVIATGGYVSFPAMLSAYMLASARVIPARLALLEPNAHPGLTNRMLAPLVDEVWGAFATADPAFGRKYRHTGIPVRAALLRPRNRIEAARRLGLDPSRRTILAIGGSQGARSINEAIAALVTRRALPADWQILHVSGERDYAYMQAEEREPFEGNRVSLVPYLDEMADAYELSDLVIARSGASTLGELAALGAASILIPYPFASDDHQRKNARAFEESGAAVVIEDRELNADSLWWALRSVMGDARLAAMRLAARSLGGGEAVSRIVARIDALVPRRANA